MPEDPSQDFGAFLRQARERKEITLRQIADRTKISVLALGALERNDFARLPGGIFVRSFVRAYAQETGLDVEDTVRRFVARFPEASMEESPPKYDPNPEGIAVDEPPAIGHGWRAVWWALPILLVVAYFGFGGRIPWPGQAQPAGTSEAQPVVPVPVPPPPAALEQAAAVPPVLPAASGASTDASTTPAPAVDAGAADAGAARGGPVPDGALRLTLAPREDCWVSVRAGGVSAFSGLLRAGESRILDLKGEITLTVGNAGVFAFAINGQAGRALGTAGQVATVRFGAATFSDYLEPR